MLAFLEFFCVPQLSRSSSGQRALRGPRLRPRRPRGDRVTSTSALLNGAGNPNGATTTGWFRFSTMNPGTCNDTFGTRAPGDRRHVARRRHRRVRYGDRRRGADAGHDLLLLRDRLELRRHRLRRGAVVHDARAARRVTTRRRRRITSTARDAQRHRRTRTAPRRPAGSALHDRTRAPATTAVRHAHPRERHRREPRRGPHAVAYTFNTNTVLTLTPGTTYYYCALASNSLGTSFGAVLSFTTLAVAPTVTTTGRDRA